MENSNDDIWVFGYGSLMWNPGFDYLEVKRARIQGVHRAPCIYSWVHRGTRERPGIVLGLARGGACVGKAFRIDVKKSEEILNYLRARELVTNVYLERTRSWHSGYRRTGQHGDIYCRHQARTICGAPHP